MDFKVLQNYILENKKMSYTISLRQCNVFVFVVPTMYWGRNSAAEWGMLKRQIDHQLATHFHPAALRAQIAKAGQTEGRSQAKLLLK